MLERIRPHFIEMKWGRNIQKSYIYLNYFQGTVGDW